MIDYNKKIAAVMNMLNQLKEVNDVDLTDGQMDLAYRVQEHLDDLFYSLLRSRSISREQSTKLTSIK